MSLVKDFRDFVNRGNVVDLAVAVVLGAAFGAVITSFVDNILMQIIAALGGEPDFNSLSWTVNDAEIRYGAFLTALVSFLIIAFAVFLVVRAVMAMQNLRGGTDEEVEEATEVELLTVRIRLIVCSIDKAQEIGLDWWKYDPHLAPGARAQSAEMEALRRQVRHLERRLSGLTERPVRARGGARRRPAASGRE